MSVTHSFSGTIAENQPGTDAFEVRSFEGCLKKSKSMKMS